MTQMFGKADYKYSDDKFRDMAIIRIDIESITGKKSGY